jgi:pyruvate ferredoxin oxidoreductase alpha subunit
MAIGSVTLTAYRPFPLAALRAALQEAEQVVVIEKALALGIGGILSTDVRMALAGQGVRDYTVIAGLGGRVIPQRSLVEVFRKAASDELDAVTFLDLNWQVVERQLAREAAERKSGPRAESILRDLGAVASRIG